jgi:hypothetical protein
MWEPWGPPRSAVRGHAPRHQCRGPPQDRHGRPPALLSGLGFSDVVTLLQSGNAVFDGSDALPDELADRIERAIADEFVMSVHRMVRTGPELRAVIEDNPLADRATQGSKFLALFLSAAQRSSGGLRFTIFEPLSA